MLDKFNWKKKRTFPLQAIITYVYAFLFEPQLTVEAAFFDSQPLYLPSQNTVFRELQYGENQVLYGNLLITQGIFLWDQSMIPKKAE